MTASPAEKRWEWIRKGAPFVIELGGRDIEAGVVTVTRRDDPELAREQVPRGAAEAVRGRSGRYRAATSTRRADACASAPATDITDVDAFREFFSGEDTESGGFVRAPWSEDPATEETMAEFGVTVRCIPFDRSLPPTPGA